MYKTNIILMFDVFYDWFNFWIIDLPLEFVFLLQQYKLTSGVEVTSVTREKKLILQMLFVFWAALEKVISSIFDFHWYFL
jgi:hypothetical protein